MTRVTQFCHILKKRNKIRWDGKGGDKGDGTNLSFERQKVMGRRGCIVV
jgi:hypothetical protein